MLKLEPHRTSSANPFFVTFYSPLDIRQFHASTSKARHRLFGELTMQWCAFPLPEEYVLSCYPETLITEDDDEPEAHPSGPESKSGSDETAVTPLDEGAPPVPDKELVSRRQTLQQY
jgi:hypothetical protein